MISFKTQTQGAQRHKLHGQGARFTKKVCLEMPMAFVVPPLMRF